MREPNIETHPEQWRQWADLRHQRLRARFPKFEWHCYSADAVLLDIALPLLNRVEELERRDEHGSTSA
jgi:hypothetical protein